MITVIHVQKPLESFKIVTSEIFSHVVHIDKRIIFNVACRF